MEKFRIAIETLNFLLKKGEFTSTTEIHNYLVSIGVLENHSPNSKDRRKLLRVLSFLESEGYIESERIKVVGRKPQKWKVNKHVLPYLAHISDEELISLLTIATFIPKNYRELPIFSPFTDLIYRLSKRFNKEKRKAIENSFVYEFQFLEKFLPFDPKVLAQVYRAIIDNRSLRVKYKNSNAFKIFPIKLFTYNGILYVGALKEDKTYRTYHLSGLEIIEELKESLPIFYRKKFENVTFFLEDEEPFLFGVRVAAKKGLEYFSEPQIFPTQFFFKREDQKYLIYLVGFTGPRFVSRFLVEEVLEIIPPSKEIIETAKKKKIKKESPKLSLSLKENKKRFLLFLEDLHYFIDQRYKVVSELMRSTIDEKPIQ